jgi:Sulfotransferase family
VRSAVLHLKSAKRLARPRPLRQALGSPDDRLVFVLGSPRSGTTFLAGAIGSVPGFVDLGEVAAVKAAVPGLAALPVDEAAGRLRRMLGVTRTIGLVRGLRGVEQTPETAFLAASVVRAFPQARLVHMLRDGRDVVCSLLERGWLRAGQPRWRDEVEHGGQARFWVEPDRREEFERASEATRAAWVWRVYVSRARATTDRMLEIRYERLTEHPHSVSDALARHLGAPAAVLRDRLDAAHDRSIGRWRRDLTREQLTDVEREAGELLQELGYV